MAKDFDAIRPLLLEAVPRAMHSQKFSGPVSILRIYFWDNHAPKGYLSLWTVSDSRRRQIAAKHGKDAPSVLWLSGENAPDGRVDLPMEGWPHPQDEELAASLQSVHRLVCKDSNKYMLGYRKLLQEVARELNKRDWSKIAEVTDDFVVVPADGDQHFGGGEDYDDIVASVPAERIRLLEQRGFLGPASRWERLP